MVTSGLRFGVSAGTTRGFGTDEFRRIGGWIADVLDGLQKHGGDANERVEQRVRDDVLAMCRAFPIYAGARPEVEP